MKKNHPTFNVPNFGAKHRKRVGERWRKPRGIDSKKRIKRSGYGALPGIGYKNSDDTRGFRPDGTVEVLIRNRKELESHTKEENVSLVLAHGISTRKRLEMQKIAEQKGLRITNRLRV